MEEGYMEDAESTLEEDLIRLYIVYSGYMETDKILIELSKSFDIPKEIIKVIINLKDEDNGNSYLESLSINELDNVYKVLIRELGNKEKSLLIKKIEQIVANRI